jgi:hypothetical protein
VPFRDITTLPGWSYRYDTDLVGMPTGARTSIVDTDNDGTIDDEAATSDIRTHAYPGFESGFELWSAGPDQRFHAVRGESVNRDNTTVTLYRKKP